ncbi:hypothetical protein CWI42_010090 [Ordospora colligata]|uniref:UBA domain-containing protein n=1 Tax=Ordospora colligata OC4 TaxID=1354746 RepID=A0A0B2ULZ3_9MICR|nr:uncharacterized protein M896_010090 [Ordospora colligata OC4]KHN70358.1 hypothetical protein M896_010090 [Ordospora colligata OC4]TBU17108.1 hypothetical protein CWI41_010090 [Ordospora colligata]TBU17358.1 hypothetical protein CWI40_010090 [Ordospora colligata]TBU19538.1 hypothetical protein CWI42_010090 [Ordospora colligata]
MEENKSNANDEEIISYLVQSGFTEEEVQAAMKETGSKDIDFLVDSIISANQNKSHKGVKQVKRESTQAVSNEISEIQKQRKDSMLRERIYKEQLINQIKADMAEKLEQERIEDQKLLNEAIEKTEDISDCKIKLWHGDGTSSILGFSKESTLDDLFLAIEARLNRKGFNLFRMNQTTPIERGAKKISEIPCLYPKGVLFVDE